MILIGHLIVDAFFGWTLLNFRPNRRTFAETLLMAALLGMYVETFLAAIIMFFGASLKVAALSTALLMAAAAAATFQRALRNTPRMSIPEPQWYEWLALAAIGEKVIFIIWQLTRTFTYFDDALQHWSGRARSLFGEVNWSFDPASPFFMGKHIGNANYPLLTVMWRALSAKWSGGWSEFISRADGLIFFIVIVGTVWTAVRRFSNHRPLAAAAAFITAGVPLLAWHAAAGYSDIAVEAFVVVAFAAVLRQEWLAAGLMAAGAVWSKNDGLVLFLPAILAAVLLMQERWRNILVFLLGVSTVAPWLIFNYVYSLGMTPGQQAAGWHSAAPLLLWNAFMTSASSSIFWIGIFACAVYCCIPMVKDSRGRPLILAFAITLALIVFVFSSTSAYTFLFDESTIHRTLLQFSGMAVLVASYGICLKLRSNSTSDMQIGN